MKVEKMFELNKAVTRKELHFRKIEMRGWERSDGLYEVEGHVTDQKPDVFTAVSGGRVVPAGEHIHDMGVKLVINQEMQVLEVSTFTTSAPYQDCMSAGTALQSIKGLRIASGWSSEVRRLLGGAQCCTHLMEILIPMGTAAFQSLTKIRQGEPDKLRANGTPTKVDSCYAYAANRAIVMQRWPNFYTGSTQVEAERKQ